ncbi:FAD-dependent oxidoreductase [Streptomyces sp. NPDC005435]|uniref:FAD-dependent oxidoreductase n=1 Tax=Streptomyces sp. NPDC005435 TaxID=3154464 RepID=UPI003452181C
MTKSERPPNAPTVLIVGAGPTGLTLACELARRGVSFRLIEAAPGPQPGSRGKGVQPRTLEAFENLGVIDHVLAHGRLAMPMWSIAPDGRVTYGGAVPESLADRPDIPYAASLITPEWRVEETLRLRLAELGGAVGFGMSLVDFEQSDDGVSAQVMDVKGDVTTVTARWLAGCDGGHSVVRKRAAIAFEGETREEVRMIVADVRADGVDPDAWRVWRHAEGIVALCPLPSTDVFQYQASVAPGQDARLTLANMQATLDRRTGRTGIRLHEPEWSSLWRANIRLAGRYRAGRVFLAGDAAHIHSPAGGQGMNTGIQDAVNLGWKLAAVTQGADPSLLDTYESERRPVAAHVLGFSTARLEQMMKANGIPIRRDASTIQLDIGYRDLALARDDRDDNAVLRAGDRAPDAPGLTTTGGERRLFVLMRGGRFTLLCFGGAGGVAFPRDVVRTLRVVDEVADSDDVADTAGHLRRAYGASDRTLVLIRPDGYVGVVSDAGDASVVGGYLSAVCGVAV